MLAGKLMITWLIKYLCTIIQACTSLRRVHSLNQTQASAGTMASLQYIKCNFFPSALYIGMTWPMAQLIYGKEIRCEKEDFSLLETIWRTDSCKLYYTYLAVLSARTLWLGTGTVIIKTQTNLKMLLYWLKLIEMDNGKLSKQVFDEICSKNYSKSWIRSHLSCACRFSGGKNINEDPANAKALLQFWLKHVEAQKEYATCVFLKNSTLFPPSAEIWPPFQQNTWQVPHLGSVERHKAVKIFKQQILLWNLAN